MSKSNNVPIIYVPELEKMYKNLSNLRSDVNPAEVCNEEEYLNAYDYDYDKSEAAPKSRFRQMLEGWGGARG